MRLGWDLFFERQCALDATIARVVQVERDAWRVDGDVDGWVPLAGKLRYEATGAADLPAVGDWVEIEVRPARILRRLKRRSVLSRRAAGRAGAEQVIAANVDTVFVVTSANEDLSVRRIERYLAIIWDAGAVPVVVVNKGDLVDDPESIAIALRARLPLVDIVTTVALNYGPAIDFRPAIQLTRYLQPGRTVALVGSSGVGKSTLINHLVGADVQRVAAVRESDQTGRHTTTARQLVVLPGGALLIDTPGMRELQLWAGDEAVEATFDDIAQIGRDCRFADCSHASEPGCTVRAAVEAGALDTDRLDHYHRLQRETAYEARKHDADAAAAHKKKMKTMMRAQKALYKNRQRLK